MRLRHIQFFTGILAFVLVLPLTFYPFLEARAVGEDDGLLAGYECLAGKLGFSTDDLFERAAGALEAVTGEIPTFDAKTKSAIINNQCETMLLALKEVALRAARAVLKKRILDTLVDQTIEWIQNGDLSTGPKFVDDWGGFVDETLQLAAGDVAREIGLERLCSSGLGLQLQLNLQRPDFSNKFRCTFDQMVGNINSFRTDFNNGGWIGYNELLKPQNNRWGLEIMAMSELEKKQAQQKESKSFEVTTGAGFLSTKQCIEWDIYSLDGRSKLQNFSVAADAFTPEANDPNKPPPSVDPNGVWRCANVKISTPGRSIADTTSKALGVNFDYIINSDDLTDYAAAIIDAGINRLIKEGVKGIKGMSERKTPDGAATISQGGYISPTSNPGLSNLGTNYTNAQNDIRYSTAKRGISNQLIGASSSLSRAHNDLLVASSTNTQLVLTIGDFQTWCTTNSALHPATCSSYDNALKSSVVARATTIDSSVTQIKILQNKIATFESRATTISSDTEARNLTSEITSFNADLVSRIGGVAQLANTIQAEFTQTTSLLQLCKIPTTPTATCP
ncbi:MAG: hypothetical protein WCV80_02515 [Candidatus Paceibacterota bacterium]|jgi:hypothetical protein